jgi:hypothetical protein
MPLLDEDALKSLVEESLRGKVVGSDLRVLIHNLMYYKSLADERGKALGFYADPATYDIEHLNRHGFIIIDKDGGEIARKALEYKP